MLIDKLSLFSQTIVNSVWLQESIRVSAFPKTLEVGDLFWEEYMLRKVLALSYWR
jgi:CRISPR/Cas system CMR subunit Cmr4 (Cas7 group RAMP superfamily)